jgi:hypothetical protein
LLRLKYYKNLEEVGVRVVWFCYFTSMLELEVLHDIVVFAVSDKYDTV